MVSRVAFLITQLSGGAIHAPNGTPASLLILRSVRTQAKACATQAKACAHLIH